VIEIFKNKPLHLIGHCIGGNISIAATSLTKKSNVINSLTLLTTPWDYSHFNKWAYIYKSLNMEMALMNYNFVPVIYTQIMFFLMFPMQFAEKIKKYFSLTSSRAKNLFMQVESWLQSGNKISKSIYMQIINEFCLQNILFKKQWYIDGNLVDLKDIEIPVCIIHAKDDQITTYKAMNPLQEQIKDSTLIEVEGGHIGYLINNKSQFQNHYNAWLDNQIQGNEICNTSI
jgi:polyhydroxyalkanoate synthase